MIKFDLREIIACSKDNTSKSFTLTYQPPNKTNYLPPPSFPKDNTSKSFTLAYQPPNSFQATMKHSPIHMNYETSDYGVHEFDPQVDFSQFLEEARQHAREVKFQVPSTFSEETGKKELGEDKKTKKSWKKSLFSWLKMEKNSKHPSMEPAANTSHISKPRKGHVSGPISGSSSRGDGMRQRRPTSGPIAYFFSPSRKVENEIPYMCLDQLNNPHHVKSYGPVYFVT